MKRNSSNFAAEENGAMTAFGLYLFIGMVVVGGLALDVANAMMARTQLQVAADAVAHAALYTRETNSAQDSVNVALALAEVNMPAARYGSVLQSDDIYFGVWDDAAKKVQYDMSSWDAVYVDVSRMQANANPIGTYFLKFAGFGSWDVRRGSAFETYRPTCFEEGIVGEDVVDLQSNNTFVNGFCVHSNTHVELNNGIDFEPNTVLSMPDRRDLVEPTNANNIGINQALRDGVYKMRILTLLPEIIDGLQTLDPRWLPDYITSSSVVTLGRNISSADFVAGSVHVVNCTGGQKINFPASALIQDAILVTNCQIHFASGATLTNAVVATTSTSANSVNSAAAMTIGMDDGCAADGGAQVLSLGSIDFSAGLSMYGGQVIAIDDISFAANATGIEGASFVAGGTASGTSNMTMGFCGGGMERNFAAEYFRLVL